MVSRSNYTTTQLSALVILRVLTGWYFLYEGVTKLLSPSWSAYGYLMDSKGCRGSGGDSQSGPCGGAYSHNVFLSVTKSDAHSDAGESKQRRQVDAATPFVLRIFIS